MKNSAPTHKDLTTADGVRLAVYDLGEGPVVLLLHGFLSNTAMNWITPGLFHRIVAAGFRVLALDFRGHGKSETPRDASHYPKDVLAADVEQMITAFGVKDYALVGYSLGARIGARLMARGAHPRRLVIAGMGDTGLTQVAARQAHFEDAIRNGAQARNPRAGVFVQSFMRANGVEPAAALHVLATQCDTEETSLRAIACPTLVLAGAQDEDNGSSARLAAMIPGAKLSRPPGDHLKAIGSAEFGDALLAFLAEDQR